MTFFLDRSTFLFSAKSLNCYIQVLKKRSKCFEVLNPKDIHPGESYVYIYYLENFTKSIVFILASTPTQLVLPSHSRAMFSSPILHTHTILAHSKPTGKQQQQQQAYISISTVAVRPDRKYKYLLAFCSSVINLVLKCMG